jgi:hypothetical protein
MTIAGRPEEAAESLPPWRSHSRTAARAGAPREQEIDPERSTLFPVSTGHDVQGRFLVPKVHAALLALVDANRSASPRMVECIYTAGQQTARGTTATLLW